MSSTATSRWPTPCRTTSTRSRSTSSPRPRRAARAAATPGRIYQLKREVLEFKRAVSPLLRPMQLLSERPMRLVDPDIQKYFRDVADHLARVQEQVVGFDELLNSILQANLAQATVAQNEDMRKITSWAAIIAVPTMVCGVYGMNFDHMPELHWKYGYPMVLIGIIGRICLAHPPRLQAQRLAVTAPGALPD